MRHFSQLLETMLNWKVISLGLMLATAAAKAAPVEETASADMEAAESQSYGFGYGTKVADKYGGTSTGDDAHINPNSTKHGKMIDFSLCPWLRDDGRSR